MWNRLVDIIGTAVMGRRTKSEEMGDRKELNDVWTAVDKVIGRK